MKTFLLYCVVFAALAGTAWAQDDEELRPRSILALEAYGQMWQIESDTSSRTAGEGGIPFYLILPIRERGQLRASGAGAAYATFDESENNDDSVSTVAGLTNFRLEADWAVAPQVLVGANVGIPTGRTELDDEEIRTLSLFLRPELASRVPRPGSGFDAGGQVAGILPLGSAALSGSLGYQYRGAYTPRSGGGEVDPGDEILASGAVDWRIAQSSLRLGAIYTHFGVETAGGTDNFQAGDKLELKWSGITGLGRNALYASVRHIRRAASYFGPDLETEALTLSGLYTTGRLGFDWAATSGFHLVPSIQARWLGKDGTGNGSAAIYGGGLEFAFPGRTSEFRFYGNYFGGWMDDGDSDVTGFGGGVRLALFL